MKFGVREICDVVLRAKTAQKVGNKIFYKNEPVCYFDTLKTSTMEGAATTVYATGGRGNARLMSWDGERTVTFTMEDALISPIGLSILTGAGLIEANYDSSTSTGKRVVQHITETVEKQNNKIYVSKKPYTPENGEAAIYVMVLDENNEVVSEPYLGKGSQTEESAGYEIQVLDEATGVQDNYDLEDSKADETIGLDKARYVLVDYYTVHDSGAFEVNITPDKFGGTFYLEASTLWRDQATKKDLPAEFIIPACRVQSNFTFSMSSSGDPSTFTFTMDAFPDYTRWNRTEKVLATIQVIGADLEGAKDYTRDQTWSQRDFNDDGTIKEDRVIIPITTPIAWAASNALEYSKPAQGSPQLIVKLDDTTLTGLVALRCKIVNEQGEIQYTQYTKTVEDMLIVPLDLEDGTYTVTITGYNESGASTTTEPGTFEVE